MTERAVKDAGLRRLGLRRGRTSLGEGQRLALPEGELYRWFGQELAQRLTARAERETDDPKEQQ